MAQPLPERRLTIADQIRVQSDRLDALSREASDERRSHARTERLLDGLSEVGRVLQRLGRG